MSAGSSRWRKDKCASCRSRCDRSLRVLIETLRLVGREDRRARRRDRSARQGGCGCAAADDHSRDRPGDGNGDQRLGAAGADLQERARFRRLARAYAACSARPAASRSLAGTSKMGERTLRRLLIIGASAVVRWAARKGRSCRLMAGAHACAQAAHAGDGRACQQDGAHRLGAAGEGRDLSSSGRGGINAAVAGCRRRRKVERRYGATVDETGSGKPVLDRAPSSAR